MILPDRQVPVLELFPVQAFDDDAQGGVVRLDTDQTITFQRVRNRILTANDIHSDDMVLFSQQGKKPLGSAAWK